LDVFGRAIGEHLHLTIKPEDWWIEELSKVWGDVKSLDQGQFLCKG